jgi:hypothetical protein
MEFPGDSRLDRARCNGRDSMVNLRPQWDVVCDALPEGAVMTARQLARELEMNVQLVRNALNKLRSHGRVRRAGYFDSGTKQGRREILYTRGRDEQPLPPRQRQAEKRRAPQSKFKGMPAPAPYWRGLVWGAGW